MPEPLGWRVVVEVDESGVELVSDALFARGAIGIEERTPWPGRVVLLAGMVDQASAEEAAAAMPDARVEPIHDDGWADEWRNWAQPVTVGDVLVQPAWLPVAPVAGTAKARVVIAIDPGRAFGGGAHVTTRLALAEVLARVDGGRVLDVGCGGGVLSVAAAAARGATVLAIDIDPNAIDATRANAERNGVAALVEVASTPLERVEGHFDLVVANILAVTLRDLAPELARLASPEGVLVASGMLAAQADGVDAAFAAHGLRRIAITGEDDWRCCCYAPIK